MKKLSALVAAGSLALTMITAASMPVYAESLDDVIGDSPSVSQDAGTGAGGNSAVYDPGGIAVQPGQSYTGSGNSAIVDGMRDATQLDDPSPVASEANAVIKKVASGIIQVLSYVTVILLVIRVLLDLLYIAIPFVRPFLANGHQGVAQGGQPGGMGGMNNGGFGGGGFGGGGFGGGGFGGGMNGGGFGGHGAMGGQQQQQGAGIAFVSNAALNAVESEKAPGSPSPYKIYAKDMVIILVITPIFLVLAVTGALTNLGITLGNGLVDLIGSISSFV
jgi:hypothetical protein